MQKLWIYSLVGASIMMAGCSSTPHYPPIIVTEPLLTPFEIREKITQGASECSESLKTTRKTAVAVQDCINMVVAKTRNQYDYPSSNVTTQYGFAARLNAVQYADGKISRSEFETTQQKILADLWLNADSDQQQQAHKLALEEAEAIAQRRAASIQTENTYLRQQMLWQGVVKDFQNVQERHEEKRQRAIEDSARNFQQNKPRNTICNPTGMGGMQCTTY